VHLSVALGKSESRTHSEPNRGEAARKLLQFIVYRSAEERLSMLNPWIIEEILKREQEQRQERERPRAELPIEGPSHYHDSPEQPAVIQPPQSDRGVVIMDI
jgi:hypothetical protein